jgi:hypothetical protein
MALPLAAAFAAPNLAPAVIDVEASGFGRDSYPIEVGLALPDGRCWCSLIKPLPPWRHWDASAEQVHQIERATLLDHGRDAVLVARELNRLLRGQTVYSDGWAHDYTWLARLYDAVGETPSFRVDTLRSLLSDEEAAVWHATKQEIANEVRLERHRASSDAKLLQLTLLQVRTLRR